ncbi:hypothetical protein [Corynebacterium mayonis]|uniref:hypothetical protein n=1 Tax=Corynebacterium mayonis TaxID=3062461 RepID=UPI0031404DF8
MASIPPLTPGKHSHSTPVAGAEGSEKKRPEVLRLFLACSTVMLGAELIHQIFGVAALLVDPSALRESALEAARRSGEQVSDTMVNLSVYTSVAMMLGFQLLIIGLLSFAVRAVSRRSGWADKALRLLQFFSGFFALRILFLFVLTPESAAVPVALLAADGVTQIIAGAAGACAFVYSMRDEVQKFVHAPSER